MVNNKQFFNTQNIKSWKGDKLEIDYLFYINTLILILSEIEFQKLDISIKYY